MTDAPAGRGPKKTSAQQMREWTGPALFSFGFRPFFFGAGVWAGLAMLAWISMLTGVLDLPTAFLPLDWHAHEFLFGYLGAVVAGFLLTAVPNWTGRLPIVGWRLAGLAAFWLLGRVAVLGSVYLSPLVVALADLSFLVLLAATLGREIVSGGNWRNLPVVGLLGLLIVANGLYHYQAAQGDVAAQGAGLRLGLGTAVMLISLIGGRIVPSFTRNWLARRRQTGLPVPFAGFDKAVLAISGATLLLWVVLPDYPLTGAALLAIGVLHLIRLARWSGGHTLAEPLVWILHLAYAFVPLGALALGVAILAPGVMDAPAAQHLWMAGAIGMMTMAVMTRATLGHSGRALSAGRGTTAIYLTLLVSVLARLAFGFWPGATWLIDLAGAGWIAAYGGFVILYGPLFLRRRQRRG